MGLSFSHGSAQWAYSGFNRFRERLAQQIGLDLNEMQGYTEPPEAGKSWDKIKDPIKYLLNHEDCEGTLTPRQCALIAPRLIELTQYWDDKDFDKIRARQLSVGMKQAASKKQKLEFT